MNKRSSRNGPKSGRKDQKKIFTSQKKRSNQTVTIVLILVIVVLAVLIIKNTFGDQGQRFAGPNVTLEQAGGGSSQGGSEPRDLAGWEKVGELKGEMQTLTIDPQDQSKYLLGTAGQGLAISENGGKEWEYLGPQDETILDIGLSPLATGDLILATIGSGLLRLDSDRKFSKFAGLPDGEYHVSQIDPRDPKTMWAGLWLRGGSGQTLYRSEDGGDTWLPVKGGPQGSDINFVYFDKGTKDTYVGTFGTGLFLTKDNGNSWISLGSLPEDDITMMAFSSDKKAIYVGTHSNGVLKSTDNGKNWSPMNKGKEEAGDVHGLATHPQAAGTVFAAGMMMGRGVFQSSDGGANWHPLDTGDINLEDVHIFQITPDENKIILGSGEHGSGKGVLYQLSLTK